MDGPAIDIRELRVALLRRGVPQWKLAAQLGHCPSTLSSYLRGRQTAPQDLRRRIEQALGLPTDALIAERRPGQGGVQEVVDGTDNPTGKP